MPKCVICGHSEAGVLSTRMQEGKLKHFCEKCIIPIKEAEQKRRRELKEIERKHREEAVELERKRQEEIRLANETRKQKERKRREEAAELERKRQEEIRLANETRKQNHIEIQNRQKEIFGATLIDKLREDYEVALNSIDIDVKKLIENGEEMRALSVLENNINTIIEIHGMLDNLYNIIYTHTEVLSHFNSKRIKELGHPLIPLRTQLKTTNVVESEMAESATVNALKDIGFNKKHWYLKTCIINENRILL